MRGCWWMRGGRMCRRTTRTRCPLPAAGRWSSTQPYPPIRPPPTLHPSYSTQPNPFYGFPVQEFGTPKSTFFLKSQMRYFWSKMRFFMKMLKMYRSRILIEGVFLPPFGSETLVKIFN